MMKDATKLPTICHSCSGQQLYTTDTSSAGGYGPDLLPKLGGFWGGAKFHVVVCCDCGCTQFFASQKALKKIEEKPETWHRV